MGEAGGREEEEEANDEKAAREAAGAEAGGGGAAATGRGELDTGALGEVERTGSSVRAGRVADK